MSGPCKKFRSVRVRLCVEHSLIFFVIWYCTACRPNPTTAITLQWQNGRATGIAIPQRSLSAIPRDSVGQWLTVRLAGKQTAVLGRYRLTDDVIVFEPLVPFTRGLHYTIWLRNKQVGQIGIPGMKPGDTPALLAVYPSPDSLPDNLLKIYLRFSRAMREGQAQQYVALLKNGKDTLPGVFLDLQPELWNDDRTLLTLWLDPGRIKRDLQPNKLLGAPLQPGAQYTLVVSANWPDEQGVALGKPTTKSFLTIGRDSLSPAPKQWIIRQPPSGGRQRLTVAFGEALDYSLLTETLHIQTEAGKPVAGQWQPGNKERQGWFTPRDPWQPGRYRLRIEGRLEDLAGNNLNRPFDRDITAKTPAQPNSPFAELGFSIQP